LIQSADRAGIRCTGEIGIAFAAAYKKYTASNELEEGQFKLDAKHASL
jgi:hypothetical protein